MSKKNQFKSGNDNSERVISRKLSKFREPDNLFPAALGATAQNLLALLLAEMSKDNAAIKKAIETNDLIKTTNETNLDGLVDDDQKQAYLEVPERRNRFYYSADLICDLFSCSYKNIIETIYPATTLLQKQQIKYKDLERGEFLSIPLLGVCAFKDGVLTLSVLDETLDALNPTYFVGFSEMNIKHFISLKSKHSKRMLRIISKWKTGDKQRAIKIETLRADLGATGKSYATFSKFKQLILIPAIEEVIRISDGEWIPSDADGLGFELIKTGRKYTHIKLCLVHKSSAAYKAIINSEIDNAIDKLTFDDAVNTYQILESNDSEKLNELTLVDIENMNRYIPQLIDNDVYITPKIKETRDLIVSALEKLEA